MNRTCGVRRISLIVAFLLVAISAPATITVQNYWRLGEDDPGVALNGTNVNTVDSVGSANLSFHGPARYSSDVASAAFTLTKSSWSINFTNTAFLIGSLISTNTDNFGIECWVKPIATNTDQVIVYNGHTGTSGWGIMINGGRYSALFGGKVIFGTHAATPGTWVHLALVRTNGTATLFFNGVPAGVSNTVPAIPTGSFGIAIPPQTIASPGQLLVGLVDEVRYFTVAPNQFKTSDLLINQHTTTPSSPTLLIEGPDAGIDGIGVNVSPASALWSASTAASWLHLNNPGGVNSNYYLLSFSYDANPGPTRTGIITVGIQNVTVTQAGSNYLPAGVLTLPTNGLNTPWSVAVDGTSKVIIADLENSTIDQWIPGATNLTTLFDSNQFIQYPIGVAVDNAHNIYISGFPNYGDPVHNYGDFEWIASSQHMSRMGLGGLMVVDNNGTNIYGNDLSTNTMFRFDLSLGGAWVPAITSGLYYPNALATDKQGNLYIYNGGYGNFIQWNPTTQALTPVDLPVSSPVAMTVDGANNFFIADSTGLKKWNAASQTFSTLVDGNTQSVAVDPLGNIYFCKGYIYEIPRAFVDPTAHNEPASASTDSLSAVVPATANLTGFYRPTSDQPWLTISNINGGSVTFAFTSNTTSAPRTANINVLGVLIPITQASPPVGTPPFLINPKILGDGSMQFMFTNLPGASFTVLTTTNLSLPLTNWIVAGTPTNIGPGLFQFTSDPQTNDPQRFYQVTSP